MALLSTFSRAFLPILFTPVVLLIGAWTPARAAPPQILGLVATATPTPLTCQDGMCEASFSSFCLERQRVAPVPRTLYRPGGKTQLTLRLTAADGTVKSVDAAPYVTLKSERSFAAVRVSLPEESLHALGGVSAALQIGPLASLVPVETDDPDNPQASMSDAEIAQYTGPMRARAENYAAPDSDAAVIAAVSLKLINATQNARYREPLDADETWRKVIGPLPGPKASSGLRAAQREFRTCYGDEKGDAYMTNWCLREVHDLNILDTTKRVWKGLAAGS